MLCMLSDDRFEHPTTTVGVKGVGQAKVGYWYGVTALPASAASAAPVTIYMGGFPGRYKTPLETP